MRFQLVTVGTERKEGFILPAGSRERFTEEAAFGLGLEGRAAF